MHIPVFVYGSLKMGLHNSVLLDDARYIGEFKTSPDYFLLSLGKFPAVVPGGQTAITGEVYLVDEDILSELDRLEVYPDMYDRNIINVSPVGSDSEDLGPMDVIMYFMRPEEIDVNRFEHVSSGVW